MEIFDNPPPSLTILLSKPYVVKWTLGKPPTPAKSTLFMNDPLVLTYFLPGALNLEHKPDDLRFKNQTFFKVLQCCPLENVLKALFS